MKTDSDLRQATSNSSNGLLNGGCNYGHKSALGKQIVYLLFNISLLFDYLYDRKVFMTTKPVKQKPSPARQFIPNPVSEKRVKDSFERVKQAPDSDVPVFVEVK